MIKEIPLLFTSSFLIKITWKLVFGKSTEAGDTDRQLSIIGAALTAGVPRMSGPTSDKDMAEYKLAAGDVANPDVPYKARLAALSTMEKLQNKYAEAVTPVPTAPKSQAEIAAEGIPNIDNRPTLETVSPKDPRVAAARAAGYTEQEIINYLGGR